MNPLDVEQFSLAAFALTFAAGVVTGLNPCCYTMIPAIVGYLGGYCAPSFKRCAWFSGWFALGLASATAVLGLIVVFVGGLFGGLHPLVRYALAFVPLVMGLHLLGILNLKAPGLHKWQPVRAGTLGAYLTGLLFSLVILPCATPVLASILSYAAGRGNALYGSSLLFTYGAGIGAPLFVFGSSLGLVSSLRPVAHWWSVVNRSSGVLLVGLGFYLLWEV